MMCSLRRAAHIVQAMKHSAQPSRGLASAGPGRWRLLVTNLTSGSSRPLELGFPVLPMPRCVLEAYVSVGEAVTVLSRVPAALPQSATLLDRTGAYATLFLVPGRPAEVTLLPACANHQGWRTVSRSCLTLACIDRLSFLAVAGRRGLPRHANRDPPRQLRRGTSLRAAGSGRTRLCRSAARPAAERLRHRDRPQGLVDVPCPRAAAGCLDLEQVHRVGHAAVAAQRAGAEQRVPRGQALHGGDC